MKKTLKLKIVKFEHALVMQVQEMQKLNEGRSHVIYPATKTTMYPVFIAISKNLDVDARTFKDNAERDEYLQNMLGWITDELFGGAGKLEVGKMCEVSDDGKAWIKRIYVGELPREIGGDKRILFQDIFTHNFQCWKYARPIGAQPTIDGDIYTWETEE